MIEDIDSPNIDSVNLGVSSMSTRWSMSAQFVSMRRDDKHTLRWSDGFDSGHESVQTGWNSGVRVGVDREVGTTNLDGHLLSLNFLSISGDDKFVVLRDKLDTESTLWSGSIDAGLTSLVLGGQTFATLGVRFLNMRDHYDIRFDTGSTWDDFVTTNNNLLLMQARFGGRWFWKQFNFDAAVAGGFGGNRGRQKGYWASGPATAFDETDFSLSALSEIIADVSFDLTDRTSFQVGVQGLLVDGVYTSRVSFGGPDDFDQAAYAGVSLGLRHEF